MRLGNYAEAVAALPTWELGAIQALGFDTTGDILSCDGVLGPKTLAGSYLIPEEEDMEGLPGAMLTFVREQRREEGGNNAGPDVAYMFYGPDSERYKTYNGRWLGAWCAATVSRALLLSGVCAALGFRLIGGARLLADWFQKLRAEVRAVDCLPGDIVSWAVPRKDAPWGGHIGVVVYRVGSTVYTVEGNGGARLGQVRVYKYELPAMLYGRGKHKLWRVVRPSRARR